MITQVSPSSLGVLDECQMKWFLQYGLKYREPSGQAAAIGSCCHAILESVAQSCKLRQENKTWTTNKYLGRVYQKYDLDDITQKCFIYFAGENSHLNWNDSVKDEVFSNIEIAKNHKLFPENHKKIISTECFFNKAVNQPWSTYSKLEDGQVVKKELRIVGVVDLVYEDDDGMINYLDYKFGQPKDWNSGQEKNYFNLPKDTQLCLYYWALKQDYPDQDVVTNLWYVKHKKEFMLFFDETNIQTALNKLESSFLEIRNMESPKCNYTYKCKMCMFSKKNFGDFGLDVDLPYIKEISRFGAVNGKMSMCDATRAYINKRGINLVIENCKNGIKK